MSELQYDIPGYLSKRFMSVVKGQDDIFRGGGSRFSYKNRRRVFKIKRAFYLLYYWFWKRFILDGERAKKSGYFMSLDRQWRARVDKYRTDRHNAFIAAIQDQVRNSKPSEQEKKVSITNV